MQFRDLAKHIEAHSKKHNAYKKKNAYNIYLVYMHDFLRIQFGEFQPVHNAK